MDRAGQAPVLLLQALLHCTRCAVGFIVGMGWGCGDPEPPGKRGLHAQSHVNPPALSPGVQQVRARRALENVQSWVPHSAGSRQ